MPMSGINDSTTPLMCKPPLNESAASQPVNIKIDSYIMSGGGNYHQEFNAMERDDFDLEELPDSSLDDSPAHQIKKLDCNVAETAHIDLEDKNTYAQAQFIPSLADTAILTATLETLNYYYSQYDVSFRNYFKNANKVFDDLMVPNYIKERMKALCVEMENEVCSLRHTHSCHGPDILSLRQVYDNDSHFFLYGLAWYPNGHIDDKKTIEKALSHSRRFDDDEFELITKHCLVNYIMDFPLSALSEEFIRTVDEDIFYQHYLTKYWIKCKQRNKSDGYDASYGAALNNLLNSMRRTPNNKYEWSAYEYFWNFFSESDQMLMALNLIRNDNCKKYQKIIFSKLNQFQLQRLYTEEPLTIIVNFLSSGEFMLTKAAWDRIKLTIECKQYESFLENVWKNRILTEEIRMQFSIYLWDSAPRNLIEYMTNVKNCQITEKFLNGEPMLENSSRFKFLIAVLSQTTPEFKQKFLQQAASLLSLNHPNVFSALINYCLNETDGVRIKENLLIAAMESNPPAGIMYRFRDLLYSNREEFNEFLKLFTSNPILQTRFKERLLKSQLIIANVPWKSDNWHRLSQFIDELYTNREIALYHKRNIVNAFLRTYCTYHDCYKSNGKEQFTEIDNILTQILNPREVLAAKEDIINHFLTECKLGMIRSLKRMNIRRFAKWCYCGNKEEMKRFRDELPIKELFHTLLSEIVERYVNGRDVRLSFSSLDELLRWKFSSKRRKIEEFKTREIRKIMNKRKVQKNVLWKKGKYPFGVKEIITWIFDGDKKQIREFERSYSKIEMMRIIYWLDLSEETTDCGEYYGHTSDESDDGRCHGSDEFSDEDYSDESEGSYLLL